METKSNASEAKQPASAGCHLTTCSPSSLSPDTDAVCDRSLENDGGEYMTEDLLMHARKLERERNDAMATVRDVLSALGAMQHEGPRLAAMRVKHERDEARDIAERFRTYVPKDAIVPLFIPWENSFINRPVALDDEKQPVT